MDGRKIKYTIEKTGDNQLTEVQTADKTTEIVRDFTPDRMTVTCTVNGVVSKNIFVRRTLKAVAAAQKDEKGSEWDF